MKSFRHYLQHHFNPLHVYCRLRDAGMAAPVSLAMSALYERYVYRFLG